MSRASRSDPYPSRPTVPRPSAMARAAQAGAEFLAGQRNPFASVDLSCLSPEARAKADAWQREQGFTPAA